MIDEAREKIDSWMSASVRDDFRKMWEWIKRKKVKLLIVFGWSVAFAIVTLKSYWLVYIQNPFLVQYGWVFTHMREWSPALVTIDYLVMIVVSLLAGALLMEFEDVFYSWIASLFLSFILSATLAFLLVWFSLGVGMTLASAGLADLTMVTRVLEFVILNVFRMWFPLVPIISMLTALCGAFLRAFI